MRFTDIPDGGSRGLDADACGEHRAFAVRRGAELRVYRNECPHEAGPLAWRQDEYLNGARTRIVCFAHGAQFEIDSGLCVLGPCRGRSLQRVIFRLDPDGFIILGAIA